MRRVILKVVDIGKEFVCVSDPYDNPHADRILEEWDTICKGLKIVHFLLYGTCLGFVRDNGYIKGDNDIDVGVMCSDTDYERLETGLTKRGYKTEFGSPQNRHYYKCNVMLDIYRNFGDKEQFLHTLGSIIHNGKVYYIPHPYDDYLTALYGNWHVPLAENKKVEDGTTPTKRLNYALGPHAI